MARGSMSKAREIGLAICDRISDESMKFIEYWDPDLHYDIQQELKRRRSNR